MSKSRSSQHSHEEEQAANEQEQPACMHPMSKSRSSQHRRRGKQQMSKSSQHSYATHLQGKGHAADEKEQEYSQHRRGSRQQMRTNKSSQVPSSVAGGLDLIEEAYDRAGER